MEYQAEQQGSTDRVDSERYDAARPEATSEWNQGIGAGLMVIPGRRRINSGRAET